MLTWTDILSNQARLRDAARQASQHRRAAGVTGSQHSTIFARPLISWTGRRLVSLGFRLLILSKEWDVRSRTVYNGVEWS